METEDKRRQTVTSMLLSNILDVNGLNKFVSELKRRDQHMEEYTETFLTGGSKNLASGGCAEGSEVQGSDSDVMNIIQGVLVVEPHEQISDEAIELVMSTDGCSPGYVKLEVRKLDPSVKIPLTDSYSLRFISNIGYFILEYKNKLYFSSDRFKEKVKVQGYIRPDNFNDTGMYVSGPAHKNKTLLGEIDYVIALECRNWPKPARDWLTRLRINQWPTKELLQALPSKCQCYVVPTGDEACADAGIQWRMSFVSIERELMWHMTDIQLKCFIILKLLLKSIENNLPENTLKTYHLKNTMFWLLEEIPAEKWNESMLMLRVSDCIQKLVDYVRKRTLSQYILPDNNLFKNRFLTVSDIEKTTTSLKCVSKNVLQIVRAGLMYQHVPDELKVSFYNGFKVRADNDLGNFIIYISSGVSSSRIRKYEKEFLRKFPDDAKQFLPSINLAIARAMYIEQLLSSGVENVCRDTVDEYIHKASPVDHLRSSLYTALFDFHEGKCGEVKNRVEREAVHVILTRKQDLQDICLSKVDNCYVPNVIILEQVLKGSRWVMKIDQLVLAYLLIFLSEYRLGHIKECVRIMDILPSIVDRTKKHKYYFVHLNCLGYCYTLLGRSELAFHTFCKSLQKLPSVVNAAVYHIAFMVNKTILVCH